MPKSLRYLLPALIMLGVSACHTDPFSTKPDVRGVKIPDRSMQDAERAAQDVEAEQSEEK